MESVFTSNRDVGSNPTLSARLSFVPLPQCCSRFRALNVREADGTGHYPFWFGRPDLPPFFARERSGLRQFLGFIEPIPAVCATELVSAD